MPTHSLEPEPRNVHWGFFDAQSRSSHDHRQRRERHDVNRIGRAGCDARSAVRGAPSPARHPCRARAEAAGSYLHRSRRGGRRQGRPDIASGHRGDRAFLRLGLSDGAAARRRAAGRLRGKPAVSHQARPRAPHVGAALGPERAARTLLWRNGHGAAAARGTVSPFRRAATAAISTTRSWSPGRRSLLPIFVDGALFSVGDGHGAQGDGEVCITAVETGFTGTFRLTARDDMKLEWPMAETKTHMITMAFDPDLDDCAVIALRQMLDLVVAAPASTATRPMRWRASPPICASPRSSTATRACM